VLAPVQSMKEEFFSKDDLDTFEGYFRYQGIDAAASTPEELTTWRGIFDDVRNRSLATPKVGLMKLERVAGEHLYAVAVREDSDLWLALWVRRSWKGDCIVMVPRVCIRARTDADIVTLDQGYLRMPSRVHTVDRCGHASKLVLVLI